VVGYVGFWFGQYFPGIPRTKLPSRSSHKEMAPYQRSTKPNCQSAN
jgi:hypothetical protein